MGAPLSISAIEIESDAILGPKLMGIKHARRRTVLDELAGMVRLWGWRCDTISSARLLVFSTGYKVSCNRYRYTSSETVAAGGSWNSTDSAAIQRRHQIWQGPPTKRTHSSR